jgi:hypothetical protein
MIENVERNFSDCLVPVKEKPMVHLKISAPLCNVNTCIPDNGLIKPRMFVVLNLYCTRR